MFVDQVLGPLLLSRPFLDSARLIPDDEWYESPRRPPTPEEWAFDRRLNAVNPERSLVEAGFSHVR